MKWFRRISIVIIVMVCVLYTYRFVTQEKILSKVETKPEEDKATNAEYQTAQPEELEKVTDIWDKIALSYLPGLVGLKMTDVKNEREIDGASYKIIDANIQKEWKQEWDYGPVENEYKMTEKHQLIGKESYLAVQIEIKNNSNKKDVWLNLLSLHIYNKSGESVISAEPSTAALNRNLSKSYYCYKLKENEVLNTEIVYVVSDNQLKDDDYYFVDMTPNNQYPTSLEEVGVLKLPLGEGK